MATLSNRIKKILRTVCTLLYNNPHSLFFCAVEERRENKCPAKNTRSSGTFALRKRDVATSTSYLYAVTFLPFLRRLSFRLRGCTSPDILLFLVHASLHVRVPSSGTPRNLNFQTSNSTTAAATLEIFDLANCSWGTQKALYELVRLICHLLQFFLPCCVFR